MTACEAWISAQHHDVFSVYLPHNGAFMNAALSGKLRLQLKQKHLQLVAGDRVVLEGERITALHERRSLISRIEAGGRGFAQALAANVDYVFICTSPNEEFNIKRVDRYLAMADGAGVESVLLITKADIAEDLSRVLSSIQALNPIRQYLLCSAITGQGLEKVKNLVAGGKSAVLMGSSGVGKSSLINAIVGDSRLETSEISAHKDKGRHTTTSRALIGLDNGGFFIDSPGIRELQLDNSDTALGFADITVLARGCRFRDCAHMKEPGCAVREAVASGTLSASRLDSCLKLKDEERKPGKRHK